MIIIIVIIIIIIIIIDTSSIFSFLIDHSIPIISYLRTIPSPPLIITPCHRYVKTLKMLTDVFYRPLTAAAEQHELNPQTSANKSPKATTFV